MTKKEPPKAILNEQELLEEIVDLRLELSQVKGKEGIYSRADYNRLLEQLELSEQETIKSRQDYDLLKKRYDRLLKEHVELNDDHNELKQLKNNPSKIHNERKAGRKPKQGLSEQDKYILKLRANGKTIKQIQDTLKEEGINVSIGAIHKIVKAHSNN